MSAAPDRRETRLGIEVKPVYASAGRGGLELEPPGEFPYTRGPYADMYRGQAVDDPPVRGLRLRRGDERALPLPARAGPDGPVGRVRPADPARLRLGPPALRRRGRAVRAWRSTRSPTWSCVFDGIPLDEVSTSMTINAPGGAAAPPVRAGRPSARVSRDRAEGDRPERHPQGVRRARELHLPAAARRCGSRPISSRTAGSGCRAGTRSRSPATTFARRARRPCRSWRSRSRTGSPTARRPSRPGLSPDEFGERLSFFFNAHNHFFQEVAKFRAARRLWARDHARALRRDEPACAGAPLPRADRRLDADRPAAREQHRPGRDPGALGGLRRRPVAAHERLRRGARAPDRAVGADRAANPADPPARGGHDRTPPTRSAAPTSSSRSRRSSRSAPAS